MYANHHLHQQHQSQLSQQPQPVQYTVIVLQPHDIECSHIRLTLSFDPRLTGKEFKSKIHQYLQLNHKQELHHQPTYYSEIGITNDDLSPHDIFEIDDDDLLMECVDVPQIIYMYHPSINEDSDLLKDYNEYYKPPISDADEQKSHHSQYSVSRGSHAMSISYQSYGSMDCIDDLNIDEDMTHLEVAPSDNTQDPHFDDTFFDSLNLYSAFLGVKYNMDNMAQLVQIKHAVLIWALRKMDDLWKEKLVQEKFIKSMKLHALTDHDITDTATFGNKLTDENAVHLIQYSPWYKSEATFSQNTYQETQHQHSTNIPILMDQQKFIQDTNQYHYHRQHSDETGNHYQQQNNDHLHNELMIHNHFEDHIMEQEAHRWPAAIGLFLFFCEFVYGLCDDKKYKKYMVDLGQCMGLSPIEIDYVFLMWESERNLANALWTFANLEYPLLN